MRFRTLGPLRVRAGDGDDWATIGAPHQRLLLTILLIEAGRIVSTDRLVHEIWGERPPRTAVHAVHVYVRRLRALLGERVLVTRGQSYELVPADTDAARFELLVADARQASNPGTAVSRLSEALALWRGSAFADVPQSPLVMAEAARLEQARLSALEDRLEAMLALGHGGDVIDECQQLTAKYPLREKLHAHHMLALYRAGRRADALEAYRLARTALVEELGLEPGPLLRERHRQILNDEPALAPPSRVTTVPRQLPPDAAGFTGRHAQLARMDALRVDARIVAVTGGPGVGKSALAVHWAHRVKDLYPDGQLHLNLRGYAAGSPVRPIEALAGFLRALGVPAERVPSDVDEAAALYRSLLAGRRMLLLLDNAHHPEQVRPLLPGDLSCFVLVTSRDRLDGLAAVDGAERLPLDPLSPHEAQALLTRLLGAHRVSAEPEAVSRLAGLCGCLPLALRIAAAQLAGRDGRSIGGLAEYLTNPDRLAVLEVEGDPTAGVRPAFGHSYRALPAQAQRVFRLCGVVSGPDLAPATVAAMAGIDVADAAAWLAELRAAHLIDEGAPGRYALHDLLRLYAAEQVSDVERAAALDRLYDYYLGTLDAVNRLLYPEMIRLPVERAAHSFDDHERALAWLEAERANLIAAVLHGPAPAVWRLAEAIRPYLHLSMSHVDWKRVAQAGLQAASAVGSVVGQAAAQMSLGLLYVVQNKHSLAIEHCTRALVLTREAGWAQAESSVLNYLAAVHWAAGRLEEAARHLGQSLEMDRRLEQVAGIAVKLTNLGVIYGALGRLEDSRARLAEALEIDRAIGALGGEARTLANLAEAHHLLGDFEVARTMLEQARGIHEKVGDRSAWATTTRALASVYQDTGAYPQALGAARTVLELARRNGNQRLEGLSLATLGDICRRMGQQSTAAEHYRGAVDLAVTTGDRHLETYALVGLGGVGEVSAARQALELARRHGYRVLEGNALLAQAEIHVRAGDREAAAGAAGQALAIHAQTGHRPGHARAEALLSGQVYDAAMTPSP